jgi:hypothetical protein
LTLFGLFMVTKFPRPEKEQPLSFSMMGIFIGLLFLFLGIYWTLF